MLSLADFAACCTVCLPVRILVSMVRRTFALSTFVQFFAVGTNQVDLADWASAAPGVPLTRLEERRRVREVPRLDDARHLRRWP